MSDASVRLPEARDEWARAAAAIGLLQALAFGDRFLLSLVATPIARALRLDDLQLGLLQGTAFILPFALATLVFGRLGDAAPARRLLIAGFAAWTTATVWTGLVTDTAGLYGARILLAAGEAAVGPVGLALIARATPRERAALATSIFSGAAPAGKGLALIGGGALLALFAAHATATAPWRAVFFTAAALNIAAAPVVWRLLRGFKETTHTTQSKLADAPLPRAALDWEIGALGLAGCLAVLASQSLAAWAPAHLHRAFGLSAASAGVLAGAPLMLGSPLGGLMVAAVLDRARATAGAHGTALALSLTAAASAAGVLFGGSAEAAALGGFVVLAVALGGAVTAFLAAMQRRLPERRRAEFASWVVLIPNLIGFGVGPALTGYLSRGAGGGGDALRAALLTVVGGACLLGAAAGALAAATAWRARRGSPAARGVPPRIASQVETLE